MKNAYSGYTYQKQVTLLLLSIMDVERNISGIEIEAKTEDNFDDLIITLNEENYQFQIKDFENISLDNLEIKQNKIYILGKSHKLSIKKNILFFKYLSITPNEKFLGFPCFKFAKNILLVSLSRTQISEKISTLYQNNQLRRNEIESFFSWVLDNRIWQIKREALPQLKTFIIKLQEKSIQISHKLLQFEKLLLIEGKPGVGKSHFANTLIKKYKNNILYRFWIGNQDRDYQERLKFSNFIQDINIKLFNDLKDRSEEVILQKLQSENKTFIIDGLDHVENYNNSELNKFITFIHTLKDYCQVIILSRPLTKTSDWKKHVLTNWNLKQTEKVLKELFHLDKYSVIDEIFKISQGYPIIVKYLAEHYKLHHTILNIAEVKDLDSYYRDVISNEKGKHSLSIFLCTKSYIMNSEMVMFIGDEKYYVEEFIKEHPYLFDIKLNRISLFHDSFNTFLRKQINYRHKKEKISRIVTESILKLEKRFQSRFSMFELSEDQNKRILVKYCSIKTFVKVIENTIDFESIQAFYIQLRETLKEVNPKELSVNNYYDLSLISNLVIRDHFSTVNTFSYTYVKSLIANGYNDDDITSSGYLFGMFYFVKTKNAILLYNQTANNHYDTEHFHEELEHIIYKEVNYISKHEKRFTKSSLEKALVDRIKIRDYVTLIIENFFIHKFAVKGYEVLKSCFEDYLNGNEYKAIQSLHYFLSKYDNSPDYYSRWILQAVSKNLSSYGFKLPGEDNEFQALPLKELILKHKALGSFDLGVKIHTCIRLALLENRKIDIESIYIFWTKYYQRKDYTLYSLPIALHTLEVGKLISLKECINLIHKVQNISEKGYRHLLAEFIKLYHPSKIIPFLEKNFDVQQLRIDWFKLPTKYINKINDRIYNLEENRLMDYHRTFSIPLAEVENVLNSNKFDRLEFTLDLFKAKISYKGHEENGIIKKYMKSKLRFEQSVEQHDYSNHKQNSQQHFDGGILTFEDIPFIKEKKLKPYDIARFSDGNYTSLPEIDIFKIYVANQISYHFKKILYNTLINKTKSINYFYQLYYHPGNILTMIKLYRNDKEFKAATNSFRIFMSLSMFELKLNIKS